MFSNRSVSRLALLSIAASTVLGGCADTDPGSALIHYRIGNDKTCSEAGVEQIRVILDEDDGIDDIAPCSSDGEFLYEGIPVGDYTIIIQGIDGDGYAIVDNIDEDAVKINISGSGAEKETSVIALTDSPAILQVRWNFGFGSCESVGIDHFLIEAYAEGSGSNKLLSETLDCDTPGEGSEGYRIVPDPDRELLGGVFGEAYIRPQDASGNLVGEAQSFSFAAVAPGYTISTTIECDESGCVGSGDPD